MEHLVTSFNEHQANERVGVTYPYIFVHGAGDALTVTMGAIKKGSIPVLIEYKGIKYNIGSISKSAVELAKLLKVFEFDIHLTADKVCEIKSNTDIMEVGVW